MTTAINSTARRARTIAQIAIPVMFAAIVLPVIGKLYFAAFEPPLGATDEMRRAEALIVLIEALPPFLLAWAMLGLTKVLREYEMGRYLSLDSSAALKRVGERGSLALLINLVAVPPVIALLRGQSVLAAIDPDIFDICVVLFASTTLTVGYVLENAAKALKAENDQIV